MAAPRLLGTYLSDHHAGALAGASLARRAASANEGNDYGEELRRIAAEIEADLRALEELMDGLDVSPERLKDLAAQVAERLGRLKPNGRWLEYSPLSRMLELEGLVLGVTGKLSLWRALRRIRGDTVAGVDLGELEARAQSQRERLEELRLRAAAEALTSD